MAARIKRDMKEKSTSRKDILREKGTVRCPLTRVTGICWAARWSLEVTCSSTLLGCSVPPPPHTVGPEMPLPSAESRSISPEKRRRPGINLLQTTSMWKPASSYTSAARVSLSWEMSAGGDVGRLRIAPYHLQARHLRTESSQVHMMDA